MRLLASLLFVLIATCMAPSDAAVIGTSHSYTPAETPTVRGALLWWCCMQSVTVRELPVDVAKAVADFHARSNTARLTR